MTNRPESIEPFRADEDMWRFAYNGAEALPSGAPPKFAEFALGDLDGAFIAILTGSERAGTERGGISVAIEGVTDEDAEVSGALHLGAEVTEAGAERIAAALLGSRPTIAELERLGFRFFAKP